MSLFEQGVRQGTLLNPSELPHDTITAIKNGRSCADKRTKELTKDFRLIVLSQDCDINNGDDHYIELLPIKRINDRHSRSFLRRSINYRKIQFSQRDHLWQAEAELISIIKKEDLQVSGLDLHNRLEPRNLNLIIDWRIERYRRRPFPDTFNNDFIFAYLKQPGNELADYMETNSGEIIDIFLHVTPMDQQDAEEYQVIFNGIIKDSSHIKADFEVVLHKHLKILHQGDNSLRFPQVDNNSIVSLDHDVPMELVYEMSEYSLSDASITTLLNLNYMCHDE